MTAGVARGGHFVELGTLALIECSEGGGLGGEGTGEGRGAEEERMGKGGGGKGGGRREEWWPGRGWG